MVFASTEWCLMSAVRLAEIWFFFRNSLMRRTFFLRSSAMEPSSIIAAVMLLMNTAIRMIARTPATRHVNILSSIVRRSSTSVRPLTCARVQRKEAEYQNRKSLGPSAASYVCHPWSENAPTAYQVQALKCTMTAKPVTIFTIASSKCMTFELILSSMCSRIAFSFAMRNSRKIRRILKKRATLISAEGCALMMASSETNPTNTMKMSMKNHVLR
mmetsp:Transcript_111434/g.296120  ORF Transcript_111434/g.296120 Transcript_111434/m.296120 type:complete len:215 (-) Transcript_111434:1031-1675(-)